MAQMLPLSARPPLAQGSRSHPLTDRKESTEKRVFVGKVTKVLERFGLVDGEILFNEATIKGRRIPPVGSQVLVEATFNPNAAHFKWNVQRVQLISAESRISVGAEGYDSRSGRTSRSPNGATSKRSRSRSRSRSPARRRSRPSLKNFCVPRTSLAEVILNVMDVKRRYPLIYIPSDFYYAEIHWQKSFPISEPFNINMSNPFHVLPKGTAKNLWKNELYPSDANFKYAAKVMLPTSVDVHTMISQAGLTGDENDSRDHINRMIEFLVGVKESRWNQTAAIGGPWSENLDGPNPGSDPSVLVKTAIRTVRALTGIDLSHCTRWHRIVDIFYRRSDSNSDAGNSVSERVTIFLPDVWHCLPSENAWKKLSSHFQGRPTSDNQNERVDDQPVDFTTDSLPEQALFGDEYVTFPFDYLSPPSLPMKPHILLTPSTTAKNGKYDCTIMSLHKLLDYRREDKKKEKAFEVSLFAELFNEMLLRDNGCLIFNALSCVSNCSEESMKKSVTVPLVQREENRRLTRARRWRDADSIAKVTDPRLLVAFGYFDVDNLGSINERDIEDIFLSLPMNLARSQVKKILSKVSSCGQILYRKLHVQATEPIIATDLIASRVFEDSPALERADESVIVQIPEALTYITKSEQRIQFLEHQVAELRTIIDQFEKKSVNNRRMEKKILSEFSILRRSMKLAEDRLESELTRVGEQISSASSIENSLRNFWYDSAEEHEEQTSQSNETSTEVSGEEQDVSIVIEDG